MTRLHALIIMLGLLLAFAPAARAWENNTTHREINRKALTRFMKDFGMLLALNPKYKNAILDTQAQYGGSGSAGEMLTNSIEEWLGHGGYAADARDFQAPLKHFYDPHKQDGQYYLTDWVPDSKWGKNPEISAKQLAFATDTAVNPYSWSQAVAHYRKAMMEDAKNPRQSADDIAYAFRALGEVMHLTGDMTLPAHVRNDNHFYGDPVEGTIIRTEQVDSVCARSIPKAVNFTGLGPQEIFDATAVYTNEHFYSNDTIYNAADPAAEPDNGKGAHYASPQFSMMILNDQHNAYAMDIALQDGTTVRVNMIHTTLTKHLGDEKKPWDTTNWEIPTRYAESQAQVLIPLAVAANAALLDRFLPNMHLIMTQKPDAAKKTLVTINAELQHDTRSDAVWNEYPIQYQGNGELIVTHRTGKQERSPVSFTDGKLAKPVVVNLAIGDKVSMEVRAGGRIFTAGGEDAPAALAITPNPLTGPTGEYTFTAKAAQWTKKMQLQWNFGDGKGDKSVEGELTASHIFLRDGEYTVTAKLLDEKNHVVAEGKAVARIGAPVVDDGLLSPGQPISGKFEKTKDAKTCKLKIREQGQLSMDFTCDDAFWLLVTITDSKGAQQAYMTNYTPNHPTGIKYMIADLAVGGKQTYPRTIQLSLPAGVYTVKVQSLLDGGNYTVNSAFAAGK